MKRFFLCTSLPDQSNGEKNKMQGAVRLKERAKATQKQNNDITNLNKIFPVPKRLSFSCITKQAKLHENSELGKFGTCGPQCTFCNPAMSRLHHAVGLV